MEEKKMEIKILKKEIVIKICGKISRRNDSRGIEMRTIFCG
jgi:hypothetical protein